jgi:hypothetical protein
MAALLKSKCTERRSGVGAKPSSVGAASRGALVDATMVRGCLAGAATVHAGAAITTEDTRTIGKILRFMGIASFV